MLNERPKGEPTATALSDRRALGQQSSSAPGQQKTRQFQERVLNVFLINCFEGRAEIYQLAVCTITLHLPVLLPQSPVFDHGYNFLATSATSKSHFGRRWDASSSKD